MNTETESQKEFDRLMNHGRKVGEMMADTVIASAPPPWEEEWFERLYTNATEQSGVAFRQAFPDITDVIVMNMQVRFQQGFEARMRDAFLSEVWDKRWQREGHNRLKAYSTYSKLPETDRAAIAGCIDRAARHLTESRSEAKYRPMLQSWLNARGWEADMPAAAAPTTDWAAWVQHHKATGEWNPLALGPEPGKPGCKVPPELLIAPAA